MQVKSASKTLAIVLNAGVHFVPTHPFTEQVIIVLQQKMKILLPVVLFASLRISTAVENDDSCNCPKQVYLPMGKEGVIQCQCNSFTIVSWYTKQQYDAKGSLLINFDTNTKSGPGYRSQEYDTEIDGSLIIQNVSLEHDQEYTVIFAQDDIKNTIISNVRVMVAVPPVYGFPVVGGRSKHHYVYMDVERNGVLTCLTERVHPIVNMTWTVADPGASGKIHFKSNHTTIKQNADGTYDVSLNSVYEIDELAKSVTVQCNVAGEIGRFFMWNFTIAELNVPPALFIPGYPIIDDGSDPQHLYADVNRNGQLRCSMKNVTKEASLQWKVLDGSLKEIIDFKSEITKLTNEENRVDIVLTSQYNVKDNSVERIALECHVTGENIEEHLKATKIDLLFPKVPSSVIIDGCYSKQDHCLQKVNRLGEITCYVKDSPYELHLTWDIENAGLSYLDFKNENRIVNKRRNLYDVSISIPYAVKDESVTSITTQCSAKKPNSSEVLSKAKVSLIFHKAVNDNVSVLIMMSCVVAVLFGLVCFLIGLLRNSPKQKSFQDPEKGESSCSNKIVASCNGSTNVADQPSENDRLCDSPERHDSQR